MYTTQSPGYDVKIPSWEARVPPTTDKPSHGTDKSSRGVLPYVPTHQVARFPSRTANTRVRVWELARSIGLDCAGTMRVLTHHREYVANAQSTVDETVAHRVAMSMGVRA
jgi:hypothetical protein